MHGSSNARKNTILVERKPHLATIWAHGSIRIVRDDGMLRRLLRLSHSSSATVELVDIGKKTVEKSLTLPVVTDGNRMKRLKQHRRRSKAFEAVPCLRIPPRRFGMRLKLRRRWGMIIFE